MPGHKNIFAQLKAEHQEVKSLLKKAQSCSEDERQDILEKLEMKLIPHARGEEKTLYAALRQTAAEEEEGDALILSEEAYEEHRAVDDLLDELKGIKVSDERWLGLLAVIKENLEHHIEEEEQDLFAQAKSLLNSEELTAIFESYQETREEFEEKLPGQDDISERDMDEELKKSIGF